MINELHNDIIDGKVLYSEIDLFYKEIIGNSLHQRLLLISLNDEGQAKQFEKIIDDFMEKNKQVINDLLIVKEDLVEFLYKKESQTIKLLDDMIISINKGELSCFQKNYEKQFTDLMDKFKAKADERSFKKKVYFLKIYLKLILIYIKIKMKNALMKLN